MASGQKSTTTSLAKGSAELPATSNPASNVPAFMQGAQSGKESFDVNDLVIPRVALLQGISPPVMSGLGENAHFWHTINEVDLGPDLQVVPLLHRKQYTLWNPLHMGGGVIARASDGKTWDADFDVQVAPYKDFPKKLVKYVGKKGDPVSRDVGLGAWGSMDPENPDSGPAATLSHIILFRALDFLDLGPFIVFLQRSSEPVARQFLTKLQIDKAPIFGQVYTMGSRTQSNAAGQEFNQYTFAKNGYVQTEELFREFEAEHTTFKGQRFRTNDEDAQEPGGEGAGGGDGGPAASKDDSY